MLTIGDFARLGQISPRMLRHYDEIGLLAPDHVDPTTGYRHYSFAQLGRLHRLLALRDLDFTLEQIGPFLDEDVSVEELRGMLRLRGAEIEATLSEERARLRRVEAHLRAIERSTAMEVHDIVIKRTEPTRIAEATGRASGFGEENLNPVFVEIVPEVLSHLGAQGVAPGIMVAWYEEPAHDGSVVLHAGFDLGDQDATGNEAVSVVDLPIIEVASVVHRGSMQGVVEVYESLLRWIDDSGYRQAGYSRELYHEWHEDDQEANVTELQVPITAEVGARASRSAGKESSATPRGPAGR